MWYTSSIFGYALFKIVHKLYCNVSMMLWSPSSAKKRLWTILSSACPNIKLAYHNHCYFVTLKTYTQYVPGTLGLIFNVCQLYTSLSVYLLIFCFFHRLLKINFGFNDCQVFNWAIQYHLCSLRGLWGVGGCHSSVVRGLVPQAKSLGFNFRLVPIFLLYSPLPYSSKHALTDAETFLETKAMKSVIWCLQWITSTKQE